MWTTNPKPYKKETAPLNSKTNYTTSSSAYGDFIYPGNAKRVDNNNPMKPAQGQAIASAGTGLVSKLGGLGSSYKAQKETSTVNDNKKPFTNLGFFNNDISGVGTLTKPITTINDYSNSNSNSSYKKPTDSQGDYDYDDKINTDSKSLVCSIVTNIVGLDNLGNTCYMNTCLQVIIHTEPFIRRLVLNAPDKFTRASPLSHAFHDLCSHLTKKTEYSRSSISPTDVKKAFGHVHANFLGYSQHDTQEFCRIFLEDVSKEMNLNNIIPSYKELCTKNKTKEKLNVEFDALFRSREDSIVIDTFYGQFVNIFTCCECSFQTYSFEKFLDIPLLLSDSAWSGLKLFDLLDDFFQDESITWESKCEKCKEKTKHDKNLRIADLPEVLILSFQRCNGRMKRKNSSKIQFDEIIDITEYVDKGCIGRKSTKYNLYAISNHTGSIDFGHYYAYVKIHDIWYEFNDSFVSKCYGFSLDSSSAYVLFYQRADIS